MNERIKELARQAYVKDSLEHDPDWKQTEVYNCLMNELDGFFEKFAELIIKECAEVAKETRWAVPPSQEQIARGIKQHFGVEE
jgi:hypothetical protein